MKKQEVIDLASRRGLCVYEQYKGRKVYYKVRIPVFEDEKEIPTSYRDELVRNIKEVKQLMEKIWEDILRIIVKWNDISMRRYQRPLKCRI